MTNGDVETFWTVSAQVIPVLALAVVLEARALARQFSKKKQFGRTKARHFWGVTYLLLSISLSMSMSFALFSLRKGMDSTNEVSRFSVFAADFTGFSIIFGLVVAFSLPLSAVTAGLLNDRLIRIEDAIPWSRRKRTARSLFAAREYIFREMRDERSNRHELLLIGAEMQITRSEIVRNKESLEHYLREREYTLDERSKITKVLCQSIQDLEKIDKAYAIYLELLQDSDKALEVLSNYLAKGEVVEAALGSELDQQRLEWFRKLLSRVSKPAIY